MLLRLEPSGGYVSTRDIISIRVEGSDVIVTYRGPVVTVATIKGSSPEAARTTAEEIATAANERKES